MSSYRWRDDARARAVTMQMLKNREAARQRLIAQLEYELAGVREAMNKAHRPRRFVLSVKEIQARHGDNPELCLERLRDLVEAVNGKRRRTREETWAEIQFLTNTGSTLPEIAGRLGVTENTVLAHFHRRHLKPPYPASLTRESA